MHTDGLSHEIKHEKKLISKLQKASDKAIALLHSQSLQKYDPSEKHNSGNFSQKCDHKCDAVGDDCNYSFRASFRGFVLSLVDSFPSEVGVITIRNIDAMSEWNSDRTKESTAALSIGWIQIDNHCPNAPFPVVLCPTPSRDIVDYNDTTGKDTEFLSIGIVLAPRHKSGIIVSRLSHTSFDQSQFRYSL